MKVIRQEMTLFENEGNRGRHFKLVYDYLLSIPPTSVEAERAFSVQAMNPSGGRDIGCIVFSSVVFPEAAGQQLNDA